MEISENKINNCVVKKITNQIPSSAKAKKIQGYEYVGPHIINTWCVFSNKGSGKTTLAYNLLDNILNSNCEKVYIFSATMYHDESFKLIKQMLEKKNIDVEMYDSFIIEEGKTKINLIDEFLKEQNEEAEKLNNPEPDPQPEPVKPKLLIFDQPKPEPELDTDKQQIKRKRKNKKKCAKFFFYFDDMTTAMKNKSVAKLIKQSRHISGGVSILVISQYPLDITPDAITNANKLIIFQGFSDNILKKIFFRLTNKYTFEQFKEIYEYATGEKYNFLMYNSDNQKFYKNFNTELKIKC